MELLTVKEVADLKGCSEQYIKKLAKDKKIESYQSTSEKNRMKYLIPVTALPPELQARYYKRLKTDTGIMPEKKMPDKQKKNTVKKAFEDYSESEREEIAFWTKLLDEWQGVRSKFKNKTEIDPKFVSKCQLEYPDIQLSVDILYRKYSAYKNNDIEGLIDKRGGWNKGSSSIPEPAWEYFLYCWLDENKPPLSRCYQLTVEWAKEFYPDIVSIMPTERSYRRHVESDINKAVVTLMRDGEKALTDRCLPYVDRLYDNLHANDVWIADNHTFDIQSMDSEGTIHRLYLTAFLDAKTGVLTGWNVCENPCSQSTIIALRHGIKRFGIPKMLYLDNGSEFLTHDVGGRGHRTRKNAEVDPPTIFNRLGIEMRNALVRNAKAKPIERTFYTLKNQFSKAWEGYCGGTILERPESLKRRIKNGDIPMDFEIREFINLWIDGDFNMQAYGGTEKQFKNMSRIEAWNKDITNVGVRQPEHEDDLNLMLARSTRYQKVKRNGVYVDIGGEKLWYYDPEQTYKHLDEEVYVRYDPAELLQVRVYDKEDRYLYTWGLADTLMVDYITTAKQEISDATALQRRVRRFVKEQAAGITAGLTNAQRINLVDISMRKAAEGFGKFEIKLPSNIIPVRANEPQSEALQMAVGDELVKIDLSKMTRNAERRKE